MSFVMFFIKSASGSYSILLRNILRFFYTCSTTCSVSAVIYVWTVCPAAFMVTTPELSISILLFKPFCIAGGLKLSTYAFVATCDGWVGVLVYMNVLGIEKVCGAF